MISVNNVSLRYGKRALFDEVNVKFIPGNCYGLIGANGAGKSTFLKILSGELEANKGEVSITPGERLAVLKQNQNEFDDVEVLKTVMQGHSRLFAIMQEKDALYAKTDFTEADGLKAAELEGEFQDLDGWQAESDAAELLIGLGITAPQHDVLMKELDSNAKVRVLLAQALFGNPNILLLDEPTNNLDLDSVKWLENFLARFEGTVIVVSHDRHFLNQVCTHIADIDYSKLQLYVGNYDFWYESSQLAMKLMRDSNKRTDEKRKELEAFIARFSANASKSKQATSRKKQLEKLTLEDIKPSSRKYPFVHFKSEREAGKQLLSVEKLSKNSDDETLLNQISFVINKGDKIAFVGSHGLAKTALFKILMNELEPDEGAFTWGITTSQAYFPKDSTSYFDMEINLIDWLRQYSKDQDETFIRGFLGRMLFSGEEALKKANVLSGGEKVRCMLSKMMLSGSNVLIFDEPTNHLDLESITALNNSLRDFDGTILFVTHDHQFIQTVANRIMEITPYGVIDKMTTYEEYLESEDANKQREVHYNKK